MKLSLLFLLALVTGCAAHKTAKPSPAHLSIPSDCIMDIQSTKQTKCDELPADPFRASCDKVIVHFRCVRAVKAK
jgi:hypothetical protein